MGKKVRRIEEKLNDEDTLIDYELEAELAALQSIKEERNIDKNIIENPTKRILNETNVIALKKCLQDLDTYSLPFLQTQVISEHPIDIENELDDLGREMAFYNHALLSVSYGRKKLDLLNIPTRRPDDYFCEQIKSDAHMAKVKDRLLIEQKRIEAFESRKSREVNKKYQKQIVDMKKDIKESKIKNDLEKGNRHSNSRENGEAKSKKRQIMVKYFFVLSLIIRVYL